MIAMPRNHRRQDFTFRVANGILESDYSNGSYEIKYVSTFLKNNNNTGGIIQLGYCYISIFMDR